VEWLIAWYLARGGSVCVCASHPHCPYLPPTHQPRPIKPTNPGVYPNDMPNEKDFYSESGFDIGPGVRLQFVLVGLRVLICLAGVAGRSVGWLVGWCVLDARLGGWWFRRLVCMSACHAAMYDAMFVVTCSWVDRLVRLIDSPLGRWSLATHESQQTTGAN
jgi:hypothetical protein